MAKQIASRKPGIQDLLADLKACSKTQNLRRGKQVHAEAVECGHGSSIYVAAALVNMYAKCGSMVDARQVFDSIEHPNVVALTALILGYAENGQGLTALGVFIRMRNKGHASDSVTFVAALKACASLTVKGTSGCRECSQWGRAVFNLAVEDGCDSNAYVQGTLIDMYTKCGCMLEARQVFDSMKYPDVVCWNALIQGYVANGEELGCLDLLTKMRSAGLAPNFVTFVAILKACSSLALKEGRDLGKVVHNVAVDCGCNSHTYVQSSLIDTYSKCGSMVDARQVFDSIEHPDVVPWTALILGYADNGEALTALHLFIEMQSQGPAPNSVTSMAALKACGSLGGLEFGRTLHTALNRAGLSVALVTSLVDFYAKCGSLTEAQSVFDLHAGTRDVITWNALLAGYSSCGDHKSVYRLFERMQDEGFHPDAVTYLYLLASCSHAGVIQKGRECFDAMLTRNSIVPMLEHYNCMLDGYGRANMLDEAMALLQCMSCSPNDVTWRTVLGACHKWRNAGIGRLAFQSLIDLSDSACVLLEQIYQSRGLLLEQEMILRIRKTLRTWTKPGATCWTNAAGGVHRFMEPWSLF